MKNKDWYIAKVLLPGGTMFMMAFNAQGTLRIRNGLGCWVPVQVDVGDLESWQTVIIRYDDADEDEKRLERGNWFTRLIGWF